MPELFPVGTTAIDALLRRLEVRLTTPRAPLWELSNTIIPVSLVDSGVTLAADVNPGALLFATEGVLTAPLLNALLADTGSLPAGNYEFMSWVATNDANNIRNHVEHRNADNTGNNWTHIMMQTVLQPLIYKWSESLLQNERVRIIVAENSTAASLWTGFIWRRLLPS